MAKNVLGTDLQDCCTNPITGFYRDGKCNTGADDYGMHTVCICVTQKFLDFSSQVGNDLQTPHPEINFVSLKEGDYWCLCLERWKEAYNAGHAPKIKLKSTHVSVLEHIDLDLLKQFSS